MSLTRLLLSDALAMLKSQEEYIANLEQGVPLVALETATARVKELEAMLKVVKKSVKPVYDYEKYGDHLPHCNNCEKRLASYSVCKRANYCSYCGGAVKWK